MIPSSSSSFCPLPAPFASLPSPRSFRSVRLPGAVLDRILFFAFDRDAPCGSSSLLRRQQLHTSSRQFRRFSLPHRLRSITISRSHHIVNYLYFIKAFLAGSCPILLGSDGETLSSVTMPPRSSSAVFFGDHPKEVYINMSQRSRVPLDLATLKKFFLSCQDAVA
ncbi:hypothetical protein BDY24DRAFT_371400 [Mrakia frigida]|uniref:uncharacterized protein n=1 Tax=Mrakia frigida TaxID=29902 RepID=UPI003FCC05FB